MTYRPYPNAARALRQVQRHPRPASSVRLVSMFPAGHHGSTEPQ